jgi:hypothetical protein
LFAVFVRFFPIIVAPFSRGVCFFATASKLKGLSGAFRGYALPTSPKSSTNSAIWLFANGIDFIGFFGLMGNA